MISGRGLSPSGAVPGTGGSRLPAVSCPGRGDVAGRGAVTLAFLLQPVIFRSGRQKPTLVSWWPIISFSPS